MLAASIDVFFLLFWQPAALRANFSIVFFGLMPLLFVANKFLAFFLFLCK